MTQFMSRTPANCFGHPANLLTSMANAINTKPCSYNCHAWYSSSSYTDTVRLLTAWMDVGSPLPSGGELLKSAKHLLEALILPLSLHLLSVSLSCSYSTALFLSLLSLCVSHPPRSRSYAPVPSPAHSHTEGCPSELSDGAAICIHRALP